MAGKRSGKVSRKKATVTTRSTSGVGESEMVNTSEMMQVLLDHVTSFCIWTLSGNTN